ncbi:MAG: hypothetical protein ABFS42_07685 [Candidatus Krumholzibacteriota bacterium]
MTCRQILLTLTILIMSSPAYSNDNAGFIHGTVTLHDGDQHTGFIRWEDEEAFWNDLFHSRQTDLPWLEHVDMAELKAERRRRYFETHGMFDRVMWTLHHKGDELHLSRLFICRFGDLDGLEIDDEENVTALIRGGERVPVHGYSNDVSSDLIVYPAEGEPVEVEWDDLASIDFSSAPAGVEPYAQRLYGKVESTEGTYEGFIQWDQSECTSIDILDGDDHEIPMGDLRSLTKNRKGNSDVVLKDGHAFPVSGSNDVGGGNRGVMVENPEWGRVTVAWKRFVAITFIDGKGSGPGRDQFPAIAPLQGTVTGTEGETWIGRIVYDLDEAYNRDIFNGALRDLEFDIPFGLIRSIENKGDESCRVSLVSGRILDLGDSQDTGKKHGGLLVFEQGMETPTYIPWSRVGVVTFDQ